ncbi:hypothetical protein CO663_32315 [Rhizobium anhuiense]|nr:hypothetical protein CO663_32315 [Rhizobium anhuiense]
MFVPLARVPLSDEFVADRLGLSVKEFLRYRGMGLVVVAAEVGTDWDAGEARVSCQMGNRLWQARLRDGAVTHEETIFLRGKRSTLRVETKSE